MSKLNVTTAENIYKPYHYYIYTGYYPMVRTIHALLNDPIHGLPWGFTNFISNDHRGQLIIHKAGLLPYRANMQVREVNVSTE